MAVGWGGRPGAPTRLTPTPRTPMAPRTMSPKKPGAAHLLRGLSGRDDPVLRNAGRGSGGGAGRGDGIATVGSAASGPAEVAVIGSCLVLTALIVARVSGA